MAGRSVGVGQRVKRLLGREDEKRSGGKGLNEFWDAERACALDAGPRNCCVGGWFEGVTSRYALRW